MIELSLGTISQIVGGRLVVPAGVPADGATVVGGAVQTDSREVTPGGIFFAKPGETTDGHLFVPAAVEEGAVLAVVEREVDAAVAQIIVDDVVEALGALAHDVVARVRAAGRLRVVAVTGSNGKTTTKNLLREILSRAGSTVAARASFNNEVGAPMTMLEVTDDTEFLVAEMGASRIGEIARLVRLVRPDVGIVLKVGLAHAGEFGGIEATQRAKSEMVTGLEPGDTAVLNADDPRVIAMAELTHAGVRRFGLGADAEVRADDIVADAAGTRFRLHLPGGREAPVRFRVLGEHHVMNALAAAAAADVVGVDLETIVAGLQAVTRAERWRMEVLGGARGVTVINDAYNASPDSMAAALKTLAQLAPADGRTFAVLGEMSELGEFSGDEHDRIGLLAVRLDIDRVVVVGTEARRLHISTVNEGSWDGESVFFETQDAAFDYLTGELRSGDVALVKSSNSAGLRFLGDRLGEYYS